MKKITAICAVFLCFLLGHTVHGDLCPNHKDRCPSSATCCILNDGSYGCCPYKNAQCCSDKIHCCPPGTKCNTKRQSCDSLSFGFPYLWMVPIYNQELVTKDFGRSTMNEKEEVVPNDSVDCPDGRECPQNNTCCQMPPGNYGCCTYSNANCCTDRMHCCPEKYNCDMKHGRCIVKSSFRNEIPIFKLEIPLFNLEGGTDEAPTIPSPCTALTECDLEGGYVCCTQDTSSYCCPPGTVCGEGGNVCLKTKDHLQTNPFDEQESKTRDFDIICPDKSDACPSSNTCCLLLSGRYGCCPMPEATCCPDKAHCCPNGYVCGEGDCERKPFLNLHHRPVFARWSRVLAQRP